MINLIKNIFITFPTALFIGAWKSILFIGINLKTSFSMKEFKQDIKRKLKNRGLNGNHKKIIIFLIFPLFVIASLIATVIMIPVNIFCCSKDYIKNNW